MSSHLFLTQTHLDQDILKKAIAKNFLDDSKIFLNQENLNTFKASEYQENWEKHKIEGKIIEVEFSEKNDFNLALPSWYQNYPTKTLIFLGDLNLYSELLQEGMLRFLEEPPQNLEPILFAHNLSQVLPTIRSRARIQSLPKKFVLNNLDKSKLAEVSKKLPGISDSVKKLIVGEKVIWPVLTKIERWHLDFWLWQVQSYLEEIFKDQPHQKISQILKKVLEARLLNNQNLQKKMALGVLDL